MHVIDFSFEMLKRIKYEMEAEPLWPLLLFASLLFGPCLEITVIGVWTGIVKVVKNSLAQNCDNILARVA